MIVKELSATDAAYLLELPNVDAELPAYETSTGTGEPLDDGIVQAAVTKLEVLRSSFSNGMGPRHPEGPRFDAEACSIIHTHLDLNPVTAANARFWTWLAVARFRGIIEWRNAPTGSPAHFENYGVGSRWRNYIARLWFRAETAKDPNADDPYWLAKRGTVDFWESGIVRKRYGSCRPLVRALVRYQYPGNGDAPRLHPTRADGVRLLYKLIRRIQATVALEYLDEDEACELLSDLGSGLRPANE